MPGRVHGVQRLFVAAYPPIDAAGRMLQLLDGVVLPAATRTPVEQVHLTLQFIGDTPARDAAEVLESVRRSASGIEAFRLTPTRLMSLPERGPARLVAVGTDSPAGLVELHRRLAQRLARNVRGRTHERFRPHLTLARFGHEGPAVSRVDVEATAIGSFVVDSMCVMKSTLRPGGAVHEVVEWIVLGG